MSVQSHLSTVAAGLVLRASEKDSIRRSIATLQERADSYFGDQIVDHLRFGSSTRGTQLPRVVDARSDVDYMLIFDNSDDFRPQTYLDRLRRFVDDRYATSEVHQSHPTVVLSLGHIHFDLVPAYQSYWTGLKIPAPASNYSDWLTTDPKGFSAEVAAANKAEGYQFLPVVRLVKYWNARNGYVFPPYDLERKLVAHSFWLCSNLKEYFYSAILGLSAGFLAAQWKVDQVSRAKQLVATAKSLEARGYPALAEAEIAKLVPQF